MGGGLGNAGRRADQVVVGDDHRQRGHRQACVAGIGAADPKAEAAAVAALHEQVVDGAEADALGRRPVGCGEAEAGGRGAQLAAAIELNHHIGAGLAAQGQADRVGGAPLHQAAAAAGLDQQHPGATAVEVAGVAEVGAAGAAGVLAIVGARQFPISADYKIGQLARRGPATGVLAANRAGIGLIVVAEPIHQGAGGVIEIDLIGAAEIIGGTTDHFDAIRQAPGTAECGGSAFGEDHRFTWINDAKATEILGSRGAAIVIKAPASHVHCTAGEVGEFNEFS